MSVILFDFDGTIADSIDVAVTIINRLAEDFGYKRLDLDEIRRLQNLSSREIIKQSEVSIFALPFLVRRFRAELNREIESLQLIPGMREALLTLRQQGDRLGIVSSNSEENVRVFLNAQGLESIFDWVASSPKIFGKSRVIKRLIRQNRLDPQTVFYVGDETRDIEAAKKSRARSIAVSWGFNSRQVLATHEPDFLIQHPKEFAAIVHRDTEPKVFPVIHNS